MKTKPKQKNNPHGWFFIYVKTIDEYNENHADIIREGIVWQYSNNRTGSLKEFYELDPKGYYKMKNELLNVVDTEMDKARKRVIAVLFSYLRFHGYSPNTNYVKEVACRAGKSKKFNDIPLIKLKQIYRVFGEMYKKKNVEWTDELLNKIAEEVI